MFRVNVGAGGYNLDGWTNIDELGLGAELVVHVPPLPFARGEVDEVYAGHFFEHLDQEEARLFLGECRRVLRPGGRLGLVVPDTREIVRRYLAGDTSSTPEHPAGRFHPVDDLDEVCAMFLYGTTQPSHHRWSYDLTTLGRALERAGFTVTGEIDRQGDPRLGTGQWYQCGLDAVAS